MKKKLFLLLAACFYTYLLTAQEIYSPAQIFDNKGDTLQVQLSNFYSHKEVSIKKASRAKETLTPVTIKGYTSKNNTYLSKHVHITSYKFNKTLSEYSFMDTRHFLEKDDDVKTYKDSVFLQLLLKGHISLYKLDTDRDISVYYVEKEDRIYELPPVYHEFKPDSTVKYGYFIKNGIYNQVPALNGNFLERKSYVDTLIRVMTTSNFYSKAPTIKEIEAMKFNQEGLIALLVRYNSEYPEGSEVMYKKRRLGKIYFGFTVGDVKPLRDEFYTLSKTMNAEKTMAYSVFALIPNYGKKRNLFYKVGFTQASYKFETITGTYKHQMTRQLSSIMLGLRYASIKGVLRPYVGWALTYTYQKANGINVADGLPMIFELGSLVPIKKVSLMLQANFSPIISEQNGFQYFSYGAGLLF